MSRRSWVCLFAFLLLSIPAFAIKTKSVQDGITADAVASLLTGSGATISNIRITGSGLAVGSYTEAGVVGIENGVILSTGNIADAAGANSTAGAGASLGTPGHPALDGIVAPRTTGDAVTLEFDVVTVSPTFTIRYVFASEEYPEWVDSDYNDVFAFFVDGANIALTPGTSVPVTVNTINHVENAALYRDNEGGTETQFDGFTTPLLAVAVVEPGVTHHIRIAIADTTDTAFDSAVFIAQGGISGSQIAPLIFPTVNAVEALQGPANAPIPLRLYYAFASHPPQLSASGIPGATYSFSPLYTGADGGTYSDMSITLGPDSPAGEHVVTIRSAVGTAESFATIIAVVDCRPPMVLGIGQPQTQIVDRGQTATLSVESQGSGPTRYQWFSGYRGMTGSPVANGTNRTLTTGPVNEMTPYWVRVTNPCGTFDSNTVFAMPR
jgi:hypothetical protein